MSSQKKLLFNPPLAKRLASQSTQRPLPVCTWSAHAQPGPSSLPRSGHTLTTTANAAGELFLFGGHLRGRASSDLYVFSTRDFSTTLLKTSGEVPTPRSAHSATLIGTTTLLICGGTAGIRDQNVLNDDSLYLLNLGKSDIFISSLTIADHSSALQYPENGSALWSMVPDRAVIATIRQPWSVPSFSSSVVRLARRRSSMICGHWI